MKIVFFTAEKWEQEYLTQHLKEVGEFESVFVEGALSSDTLPDATDADALCVFVDSTVDKQVIDAFPKVRLIATRSTGFDHIDLATAKERNITVVSVPAYGENTVAEYAFALLLTLSRRIYDGYERVREEGKFDYTGLRGFDLRGKTIGIVGTGRIGKHAIKIAKGFSMEVIASDPYPKQELADELGFSYVPLESLLQKSDVVSLHVPYSEETHHLLNARNFSLMKKGAILINTSRGPVVETIALVSALRSGGLGGAALDVLEEEGVIKDEMNFLCGDDTQKHDLKAALANHVLIDMPNVIVTPHNAFNTQEALERILDTTVANIAGFAKGEPVNVVAVKK